MTSHPPADLPRAVFGTLINLARHNIEYAHIVENGVRIIDARAGSEQLLIHITPTGKTHATHNGAYLPQHQIKTTIQNMGETK